MGLIAYGRRGGPWPGWLRWYERQGWPQRDLRVWLMYGNGLKMPAIAQIEGCSVSTVHRGIRRQAQRLWGEWPPPVPNGFGSSASARRELRLRQAIAREQAQAPESWENWDQDPHGESWGAYRR